MQIGREALRPQVRPASGAFAKAGLSDADLREEIELADLVGF